MEENIRKIEINNNIIVIRQVNGDCYEYKMSDFDSDNELVIIKFIELMNQLNDKQR